MCRFIHGAVIAMFAMVAAQIFAAEAGEGNVAGKILPQIISQKPPVLPPALVRAGVTGTVEVAFTVDDKGRIIDPVVTKSSDRRLNPYALKSLADWRFVPGAKDGQIVPFHLKVTIDFSKPAEPSATNTPAAPAAAPQEPRAAPQPKE